MPIALHLEQQESHPAHILHVRDRVPDHLGLALEREALAGQVDLECGLSSRGGADRRRGDRRVNAAAWAVGAALLAGSASPAAADIYTRRR